jgi:cytoskeletal protein RodZ
MAARVQPTVTPIAGPSPSGEERARPWRPQSIAANAALAAAAAALLTFCVFSWRTTAPSPRREAQPQPVESAAPANTSQAAAAQADVTAGLTMTLVASGQCWIRAVADDAKAIERLLRAGETVQLSGENQIVLRVGDAAAVQVTINGKAVAPLGAHGEVITRRFSRADRVL